MNYIDEVSRMKNCYGNSMDLGFIQRDAESNVYSTNVDETIKNEVIASAFPNDVDKTYNVYEVYFTKIVYFICTLFDISNHNKIEQFGFDDVKVYRVKENGPETDPKYVIYISRRIEAGRMKIIKDRLRCYSKWFQIFCTSTMSVKSVNLDILKMLLKGVLNVDEVLSTSYDKTSRYELPDIESKTAKANTLPSIEPEDNITVIKKEAVLYRSGPRSVGMNPFEYVVYTLIIRDIGITNTVRNKINDVYNRMYMEGFRFEDSADFNGANVINILNTKIDKYTGLQIPSIVIDGNVSIQDNSKEEIKLHPNIETFIKKIKNEISLKVMDTGTLPLNRDLTTLKISVDNFPEEFYKDIVKDMNKIILNTKPSLDFIIEKNEKGVKSLNFPNIWKEETVRNFRIIKVNHCGKAEADSHFIRNAFWGDFLTMNTNMFYYPYHNEVAQREHIMAFKLISILISRIFKKQPSNVHHKTNSLYIMNQLNFLGYSSFAQVWSNSASNIYIQARARPTYIGTRWKKCMEFFFKICECVSLKKNCNFSELFCLVDSDIKVKEIKNTEEYLSLFNDTNKYFDLTYFKKNLDDASVPVITPIVVEEQKEDKKEEPKRKKQFTSIPFSIPQSSDNRIIEIDNILSTLQEELTSGSISSGRAFEINALMSQLQNEKDTIIASSPRLANLQVGVSPSGFSISGSVVSGTTSKRKQTSPVRGGSSSKRGRTRFGNSPKTKLTSLDYEMEFYKFFKENVEQPEIIENEFIVDDRHSVPTNDACIKLFLIYLSHGYYNINNIRVEENNRFSTFFYVFFYVSNMMENYNLLYYNDFILTKLYKMFLTYEEDSKMFNTCKIILDAMLKLSNSLHVKILKESFEITKVELTIMDKINTIIAILNKIKNTSNVGEEQIAHPPSQKQSPRGTQPSMEGTERMSSQETPRQSQETPRSSSRSSPRRSPRIQGVASPSGRDWSPTRASVRAMYRGLRVDTRSGSMRAFEQPPATPMRAPETPAQFPIAVINDEYLENLKKFIDPIFSLQHIE